MKQRKDGKHTPESSLYWLDVAYFIGAWVSQGRRCAQGDLLGSFGVVSSVVLDI